jgi:phage terminase Nu1 subunit (DNA packaging protein)
MGPADYTQEKVLADLTRAINWLDQANNDVKRGDRVDALDSLKLCLTRIDDARLRLTASVAADPARQEFTK